MNKKSVLSIKNLNKIYSINSSKSPNSVQALKNLNLDVKEGETFGLLGPNGAGKTTSLDLITGRQPITSGSIKFKNTEITKMQEHQRVRLGIGRKFQKPTVFENQTVFSNLELAMRGDKGILHALFSKLRSEDLDWIKEVTGIIGLDSKENLLAGALSHGQKQWLEIGMLLIADPRLMLIDEPVAGMTASETERTAELLISLAGDRTVVVVEHDMDFVRSIARTVTVLHQGSVIAEGSMSDIQSNPAVVEVYLGEEQ